MFHIDQTFIVGASFIFFVGLFIIAFGGKLNFSLNSKIKEIKNQLDEARFLKDEAEKLLSSYKKKQADISREAEEILAQAKQEAKVIIANAKKDVDEDLSRKNKDMMLKINNLEASIMQKMHSNSIDIAISAVRQILADNLTSDIADNILQKAMSDLQKKLH